MPASSTHFRRPAVGWLGWVGLAVAVATGGEAGAEPAAAAPSSIPRFTSLAEALAQGQSQWFWFSWRKGASQMGDAESHFAAAGDDEKASFDIGNNAVLANVSPRGVLRSLSVYRETYGVNAGVQGQGGAAGVWTAKDNSTYGPYAYRLVLGDETVDLGRPGWDGRTGLLGDLFPLTQLTDPQGRATLQLLTFAPIAADGGERVRGVVYGLSVKNMTGGHLRGRVVRPRLAYPGRTLRLARPMLDRFDFDLAGPDGGPASPEVPFDLAPGQTLWVPTLIYPSGGSAPRQMATLGSVGWLRATWSYYRSLMGNLRIPAHPFLAEFYERSVMAALQSLAISESGQMAGSNWGSAPVTRDTWMKDCYYQCLPFTTLDPGWARRAILWFDRYSVRPTGTEVAGGVTHSVGLAVASPLLGGLYYQRTADAAFFRQHPELKVDWENRFEAVAATRADPGIWLFPTRFVSDGPVRADYHTGSNIAVWRALSGAARILREVYCDAAAAARYEAMAARVRDAILLHNTVPGRFGAQLIEGTYRDSREPDWVSDGEESDVTLAPFYGFMAYDDARYLNYMRFSLSPENRAFDPAFHSVRWKDKVVSTSPAYNKGLCAGLDAAEEFGEHGYYTELRRVTDMDGSVWWWSYGKVADHPRYGHPVRAYDGNGKAGWTSGVHAVLLPSRFLGLDYDAPTRRLRFAPLALIGGFSWQDFPQGDARFSVGVDYAPHGVRVTFANHNDYPVELDAEIPVTAPVRSFRIGGEPATWTPGNFTRSSTLRFRTTVGARQSLVADALD